MSGSSASVRSPIGREVIPATTMCSKLSQSLQVVIGWRDVELPSRFAIGAGKMRKLTLRIHQQHLNFMIVIHQSLLVAQKGLSQCRRGWKATRILLGEESDRNKGIFVKKSLEDIRETASDINELTKGIKNKFRILRTTVLEIQIALAEICRGEERSAFLALLSRYSGEGIRRSEDALRTVSEDIEEIEKSLDLVIRWWQKTDSEASYLRMNGESPLVTETNKATLTEIRDSFVVLEQYFTGYLGEMCQLYDENVHKLTDNDQKYLQQVRDCGDLVVSKRGRLVPRSSR